MATTNIELDIENITGVSDADDQYIISAQKFVAASIPSELLRWAGKDTVVGTHGGDSSPTLISLPYNSDHIIDVSRNGYSAKEVPEKMKGFIANSSSLHLATETYPKYYVTAANGVVVKPDPSDSETAIVNYVDPSNIDDDSDLRNAVIFHAASQEFSKLGSSKITDWSDKSSPVAPTTPDFGDNLSISSVPPSIPSISTISYTDATNSDASVTAVQTATASAPSIIDVSSNAPSYTKPGHPTQVSFEDFFNLSEDGNPFGDNDPGAFSVSAVPPVSPSINTVTYTDATNADAANSDASNSDASASTVGSVTVGSVNKADITGNAPAYTKPGHPSQVAFADYWTLADFGDSDPGSLSITAVPPSPPSAPSYSTPGISTITVAGFGTAPSYTAPAVASDGTIELTTIVQLDSENTIDDFDGNAVEVDQWWTTLAHLIEDEEDTELAGAQIQKINSYINAYSQAMQNQLNVFNDANVEYQAAIQEKLKNADLAYQESQNEANLLLQKENQEYMASLQKYQADVSKYQAEVNDQVQEYGQNLSRYQLELNTVYTAWAKTESDNLQVFNSDIQNELNEFNKENAIYQANIQAELAKHNTDLQKAITQAQIDAQDAQREADLATDVSKFNKQQDQALDQFNKQQDQELDQFNKAQDQALALANAAKQMEDLIADNNSKIQKYSNDLQRYQSEVNDEVQEYSQKLSRYTMEVDKAFNAWAKTESDNIEVFRSDIQNELNEFNKDNVRYQMEFQEAVDKNQADLQVALANANNLAQEYRQEAQQETEMDKFNKSQDQALALANAAKQIEDVIADNQSKISKYNSELQSYQAQVNKDVSDYTQSLQKNSQEYQSKLALYTADMQNYQSQVAEQQQKIASATQNAAYYSSESKKYYEWAVAEVNMYIQNNSKMINRTMAAQAAAQR